MKTRKIAIKALQEIEEGGYSNLVLEKYLKRVKDKRDRGLITEIVYGVLRQLKRLDYIINSFSKRPIKKIDLPVIQALRIGLYQILFLDRIPERAALYETIEALKGVTKNKGAIGFANGLLRNYLRNKDKVKYPEDKLKCLATYYSHPEWLVKLWIEKYDIVNAKRLLELNNRPPELTIRHNPLKVNVDKFLTALKNKGISLQKHPVPQAYVVDKFDSVQSLPYYQEGGFMVQGAAAILAGHLLEVKPGMRVLDMAAGPGGKTTHLGQLMGNKGEIIALDIYEHKLALINQNCQRLGVRNVKTFNCSAEDYRDKKLFDRILVDAPCSGLGLIRQKPEIKWNKKRKDISTLKGIQLNILKNGIKLLKPGGIMLYSTCTLTSEENQEVIKEIMQHYAGTLQLIELEKDLLQYGLKYLLKQKGNRPYLELFPPDSNTEGFFMAKIIKRKENH